MISFYILT